MESLRADSTTRKAACARSRRRPERDHGGDQTMLTARCRSNLARVCALLPLCACAAETTAPLAPVEVAAEPALDSHTVVSLTFDDSLADQYQTGAMLAARGMRGTYYVNSGRTGLSGYLTQSQLRSLANGGHEIAGHTVSHVNLANVDLAEA